MRLEIFICTTTTTISNTNNDNDFSSRLVCDSRDDNETPKYTQLRNTEEKRRSQQHFHSFIICIFVVFVVVVVVSVVVSGKREREDLRLAFLFSM